MCKKIIIKKLETDEEIAEFWKVKRAYEENDIFPHLAEDEKTKKEIMAWFCSSEYYEIIMSLHKKDTAGGSTLQFVFFYNEKNQYLGFCMYKIYTKEDGKAFILDFCIDKKVRNRGVGKMVVSYLEHYLKREGATYCALNTSNSNNRRFWLSQGYVFKETDNHGEKVYVKNI